MTMKQMLLAAILGVSVSAFAAQGSAGGQNSNVPSQAGALRVNTPKANEKIAQNFVRVSYQLVNRGADPASSPNFTIQLDGNDPVTTTTLDYTFTGLTPGPHTVTVTLVDANGVPIANSSVSTKFTVSDGTGPGRNPSSFMPSSTKLQLASSEIVPLGDGSAPLPMLSVLGFAMLIGGICTAARETGK